MVNWVIGLDGQIAMALLFCGVSSAAAVAGVIWGVSTCGLYSFVWQAAGVFGPLFLWPVFRIMAYLQPHLNAARCRSLFRLCHPVSPASS